MDIEEFIMMKDVKKQSAAKWAGAEPLESKDTKLIADLSAEVNGKKNMFLLYVGDCDSDTHKIPRRFQDDTSMTPK